MFTRYIKIRKNTEGHREVLEAFGFEVTEAELVKGMGLLHLRVEAKEVIEEADVSTPIKARELVKRIKAGQAVLSYTSQVTTPDGKTAKLLGPNVSRVRNVEVALDDEGTKTQALDLTPFVTKGEPKPKAKKNTGVARKATLAAASSF